MALVIVIIQLQLLACCPHCGMEVHVLKYLVVVQEDCITNGARSEHSEHHSRQHVCLQEWHINGMSPNSRCVDGTVP